MDFIHSKLAATLAFVVISGVASSCGGKGKGGPESAAGQDSGNKEASERCVPGYNLCVGSVLGYWGHPDRDTPDLTPRTVIEITDPGELSQAEKAYIAQQDPRVQSSVEGLLRSSARQEGMRVHVRLANSKPSPGFFPHYSESSFDNLVLLAGCWPGTENCIGDTGPVMHGGYTYLSHQELVGLTVLKEPSKDPYRHPDAGSPDRPYLIAFSKGSSGEVRYVWTAGLGSRLNPEGCVQFSFSAHSFCVGMRYFVADRSEYSGSNQFENVTLKYHNHESLVFENDKGAATAIGSMERLKSFAYFREEGCMSNPPGLCLPADKDQTFFEFSLNLRGNLGRMEDVELRPSGIGIEPSDVEHDSVLMAFRYQNPYGSGSGYRASLTKHFADKLYRSTGCMKMHRICVGETYTGTNVDATADKPHTRKVRVVGFNDLTEAVLVQPESFRLPADMAYKIKPSQLLNHKGGRRGGGR